KLSPVHAAPVQAAPVQAPPVQAAPLHAAPVHAPPIQSPPVPAAPVQVGPVPMSPLHPAPAQAAPFQAPQRTSISPWIGVTTPLQIACTCIPPRAPSRVPSPVAVGVCWAAAPGSAVIAAVKLIRPAPWAGAVTPAIGVEVFISADLT